MTKIPTEPVIETHPFPPFLPPQARVLVLGTFPPAAGKRAMDFYYPVTSKTICGGLWD